MSAKSPSRRRRLSTTMQIQFEPGRVDSNFTDTIVRLHYDPAQDYGVGFYGDRADTLFAQWLAAISRPACGKP